MLQVAQKIIDAKPVRITITGGEPLLLFDKLMPSIDLIRSKGIGIGINTNAVLLTDEIAQYLVKHRIGIFVSFPCAVPEINDKIVAREGAFERICEGLRIADRNGLSYSLNMVITKLNIDYMEDTLKFAVENFHPNSFCISKAAMPCNADPEMQNIAITPEEHIHSFKVLKQLTDKYHIDTDSARARCLCMFTEPEMISYYGFKRTCNAGKTVCTVGYNGDIRACEADTVAYGHILKDTIPEAMSRMTDWRDDSKLPQECKDCKHYKEKLCCGGCRFDAKSTSGLANALDSIANIHNAETIDYSQYKQQLQIKISTTKKYKLVPTARFDEIDGKHRVANTARHVFVGPKTYEYITTHDTFSALGMAQEIGMSTMTSIVTQLNSMYHHKIIIEAEQ